MRAGIGKRSVVLTVVLQLVLVVALEGQSCKSGAKHVAEVWKEYDRVAKQVGCVATAAGVTVATAGVGLPAGVGIYSRCLADANAAQKVSEGMVQFWNQLAANKSLTLGPRHLKLGKEHQGTLRTSGNRMFITEPLRGDRLSLWIKKLRYRGPTDVTVCSFPPGGPEHGVKGTELASAHFAKGNDNLSEVKRLSVNGVAGRVVTVFLHMTQPWKAMQYRLRADVEETVELEAPERTAAGAQEREEPEAAPSPGDASRVVIAGPPSAAGGNPGVVRLRGVGEGGFDVRFQEWDYREEEHGDTSHRYESIPYLTLEPGRREAADGSVWETGTFRLDGAGSWSRQSFRSSFPDRPKLFLTVQTYQGSDAVAVRARGVDADGFEAALLEEEAKGDDHVAETVGYLAVHSPEGEGRVSVEGFAVPYRLRTVEVTDGWKDVGAARLRIEEEASSDEETDHVAEEVDLLELGGKLFAQIVSDHGPNPAALRQSSPLEGGGVGIEQSGRAVADEGWRTISILPF